MNHQKSPAAIEDCYPLSLLQQGMIFHGLQHPHLSLYHDVLLYRLNLSWHETAFRAVLDHLMARHAMLRTLFNLQQQRPLQLVLKLAEAPLSVQDLSTLSEEQATQRLDEWVQQQKTAGFDFAALPWRMCVHLLGADKLVLGLSFHHALWDGWSLANLVNELLTLYGQYCRTGQLGSMPPPPQYKHFILCEQKALTDSVQQAHWQRFADAALPWWSGKRERSSAQHLLQISQGQSEQLVALAAALRVQEKSLWHAVYLLLLSQLCGTDDVVGSVVVHGRPEIVDSDKTIGLFLNTLPVRMQLSGLTFAQLLQSCERQLGELQWLKHFPLAAVQQQTGLDFSASMFNYTHFHVYGEHGSDAVMAGGSTFEETNYQLAFQLARAHHSGSYQLHLCLDPAVFDHGMGQRLLGCVTQILTAMLADANQRLDRVVLVEQVQLQQLAAFNQTAVNVERPALAQWFEQQVRQTPTAIALVSAAQRLDYAELNRRANRLAHRLIAVGVGPDVPVGLCLERSVEMSVAVWAILKAGGYYVPLEPSYPVERLHQLIRSSNIAVVVAAAGACDIVTMPLSVQLLDVQAAGGTDENPVVPLSGDNLAYLLYTSGSTGQPKGVAISQTALLNRLDWMQRQYQLTAADAVLQKTPFSFDVSVWELLWPHLCGARLVMARPQGHLDPDYMAATIRAEQISLLHFVPSMLQAFLQHNGWQHCDSVRQVICSGEALNRALVSDFYAKGGRRLDNLYGPTEAAIDVTAQHCAAAEQGAVAIGKAIQNVALYIVDEHLRPCPLGCSGELLIAGLSLARGYVGQGARTAECFIPNPYGEPGSRLYRTGDLACYLPDGSIRFMGRLDQQIKLRGMRIEPAEIEVVLCSMPAVTAAVVLVSKDADAELKLIAYVVSQLTESQLRSALAVQLPAYMVPAAIVRLDAMPLNANGKLDRKALPAPVWSPQVYQAPQSDIEQRLAQAWAALLQLPQVSRLGHFFELGGHSLLSIQLLSRIRLLFKVELSIDILFSKPRLYQQAQAIERLLLLDGLDDQLLETMSEAQAAALLEQLQAD
ncbi:hypothetical protein A5320_18295 [Rheinheimera sp. SA_1]|uniref:non-ribosomal peptide synthetase n=1 Tax=Rheinheimera sp. SA_1 TaxID=1827365 RepID=UPI0007FDA7CB|nr:non-ribosomal peptide synthetase [Rheinheimera sp. SA_1]OBP13498.1 hypothetical protein A5320_18295 [Rheinheimera sp. SA_1]